jgi:putative iron-only hydrogenase system regulator
MLRIAIIGAVLDEPESATHKFNEIVAQHKGIVIGRMGIPLSEEKISVISITVKGTLNEINSFTGLLGKIHGVTVKTSISKKELK